MADKRITLTFDVRAGDDRPVIRVERDAAGVAWAEAPCGCRIALPRTPPEYDEYVGRTMPEFMTHVLDKTPCDQETERNGDETIESRR